MAANLGRGSWSAPVTFRIRRHAISPSLSSKSAITVSQPSVPQRHMSRPTNPTEGSARNDQRRPGTPNKCAEPSIVVAVDVSPIRRMAYRGGRRDPSLERDCAVALAPKLAVLEVPDN